MFTILLHSSKTMKTPTLGAQDKARQQPALSKQAEQLAATLKTLSLEQLQKAMQLSPAMAEKTALLINSWSAANPTLPSIDIFLGDIYSGLQVHTFSNQDRQYANQHLYILSGMYGVLRALDEIQPYRLEMGYKLPDHPTMYAFWGDSIARQLPTNQTIINLSAVEYTKAVFPHFKNIDGIKDIAIISPKFLSVSPKTGEPTFVTVHAKIARGAFARWVIKNRVENIKQLQEFDELGYVHNARLSTAEEPVFVAAEFKGIGLSVRLT